MRRARRSLEFSTVPAEEALRSLRATWHAWSANVSPFGTPAFFEAWHAGFAPERRAFVVVGAERGQPALVLPMFHPQATPRQWFSLGAFRADYSEVCARADDAELGDALWEWLEGAAPCDSVKLARIRTDSLLAKTVPMSSFERKGRVLRAARSLLRGPIVRDIATARHEEHPYADRTLVGELATRLHERNVHRKYNMLVRMAGAVAYERRRGREIAELLPAFFAMHAAYFRATGRESQFESAGDRRFYEALATEHELADVLAMDVLLAGGKPVAMHLGFLHAGVVYYYKPAFDMELGKASPGRILLAFMFEYAHQRGVHRFELLKGNEGYKAEWTNASATTLTTSITHRRVTDVARRAARHWLS